MIKQNKLLKDSITKNKTCIAVHRGSYGGNILQNTLSAYKAAMLSGAHMIEIDVAASKDGVLYGFHTHVEEKVGLPNELHQMTSNEIEALNCKNILGETSGRTLCRFEDVLNSLKGKCMINVDRSWFYWKETIAMIDKCEMQDHVLLKAPAMPERLQELQESGSNVMFMGIVKSMDEVAMMKSYDINLVALELIFDNLQHELVLPEQMEQFKNEGLYTWVNAIDLGDRFNLSGGLTDTLAIEESQADNWGKLIDMGFDIIQTDWPAILASYINSRS